MNGWWDGTTGEEADDKCAWSPSPFIGTGGYAYQYEWSNAERRLHPHPVRNTLLGRIWSPRPRGLLAFRPPARSWRW